MKKLLCYKCLHYGIPNIITYQPKHSVCYAPVYITRAICTKCKSKTFFSEPLAQQETI